MKSSYFLSFVIVFYFLVQIQVQCQEIRHLYPIFKAPYHQKLAFIDKTGQEVFQTAKPRMKQPYHVGGLSPVYDNNYFGDGFCLLNYYSKGKDSLYVYNTEGLIKILPNTKAISNFHDGFAVIYSNTDKQYYNINHNLEKVTNLSEKLKVRKLYFKGKIGNFYQGNKMGFLNTKGEILISASFENYSDNFKYGVCRVKKNGHIVFINEKGEIVARAEGDEKWGNVYPDGVIFIKKRGTGKPDDITRILDKTGKEIKLAQVLRGKILSYVGNGIYVARREDGKCQFVNTENKTIFPKVFVWNDKSKYKDGFAFVNKYEEFPTRKYHKKLIINPKGKVVFEKRVCCRSLLDNGIDIFFDKELIRVNDIYYDKNFKVVWRPDASFKEVKNIQDYLAYKAENLRYLNIDNYDVVKDKYIKISDLPDFEKLNPIKLTLSKFSLEEFPKEILNMTNLQELDLSDNQIEEIPEEISQLKNLRVLRLDYNKIKKLPKSILKLKKLKEIELIENPYISNIRFSNNVKVKVKDNSSFGFIGVSEIDSDGNETFMTEKEYDENSKKEKEKRKAEFTLPDSIPDISDKVALIILKATKKTLKQNKKKIEVEYKEANELIDELTNEGNCLRRNSEAEIYPISPKRRKEIMLEIKALENKEIERRRKKGNINPVRSNHFWFQYYYAKKVLFDAFIIESAFKKEYSSIQVIKEKFAKDTLVKGYNFVKMIEEQLAQNISEKTIIKNMAEELQKAFKKLAQKL